MMDDTWRALLKRIDKLEAGTVTNVALLVLALALVLLPLLLTLWGNL